MDEKTPELPAAYELMEISQAESIRTAAADLAARGCQEGTLIWLKHQVADSRNGGESWHSREGDLHCSIILQPEFEPARYGELFLVASVSMGNALATHLSPMTALGYRWPNRIMIADHVLCGIWLESGSHPANWLTVSCSVNLLESPEDFSIPAISVREAEGTTDLTTAALLQSFARQFITIINEWSDSGTKLLVDKWRIRGNRVGERFVLGRTDGIITDIDPEGSLHLETTAKTSVRLDLNSFVTQTVTSTTDLDSKS